jgi:hypothetical protein
MNSMHSTLPQYDFKEFVKTTGNRDEDKVLKLWKPNFEAITVEDVDKAKRIYKGFENAFEGSMERGLARGAC